MRIAQYQGRSLIPSRAIRWITRSRYSHSCFVFDAQTEKAIEEVKRAGISLPKLIWPCEGAVVEAWQPVLRNVRSISAQHTPGTVVDLFDFTIPLSLTEEMQLVKLLNSDIGDDYNWRSVLRFVTKKPSKHYDDYWFCSENVFQRCEDIGRPLLSRTKAWETPPDWIARSTALKHWKTVVTG